MKKIIIIATTFFFAASSYGQTEEKFKVKGTAKLIATWTGDTPNDASGTLTSGDKVSITNTDAGIYVNVIHKNVTKQLVAAGGEDVLDSTIIKVYEYDFDSDGQKEIIVIHSHQLSIATVEIFRYSSGLAERVGNFSAQFDIVLEKNIISLPHRSQPLSKQYLYKDGAFFELVYYDPNKKSK